LSRYFAGSKDINLRRSSTLNPKYSKPIRATHEPGVNGVNNAAKPRMINTTPKIVLRDLRIF